MYLCYIDKSGTSQTPGQTSHFILAGLSFPIAYWREADRAISQVLDRYGLENEEFHTAWLVRSYLEQSKIPNFAKLDYAHRRSAVHAYRTRELLRLQSIGKKPYWQAKKNYAQTKAYTHLTHAERLRAAQDVADLVGGWGHARLFAECIDKVHFDPVRTRLSVDEQAFEQVVSRFQQYLSRTANVVTDSTLTIRDYGVLIHDNNESVAKKHTQLMRQFHRGGTLWTTIDNIIETPLFVDSSLTRMVQMADLCAYALRRYCERKETDLFRRIFQRADRVGARAVGVRHFAGYLVLVKSATPIIAPSERPSTDWSLFRTLGCSLLGLKGPVPPEHASPPQVLEATWRELGIAHS